MATMRYGCHPILEAEANRILRESMLGVTKHSEKSDILTPWKQASRIRREIYSATGTPDESVRRGVFHRAINPARPDLNGSPNGVRGSSLRRHVGMED